jgi:lipoate---protein ligase
MNWIELSLPTPAENLALDEALLLAAEQGTGAEVLRFWECDVPCVILGAGCTLAADVNEPACVADAIPLLRRSSGGGTVLLGTGCLLFSLVLAYDRAPEMRNIGSSYCHILKRICQALAVPGLRPAGISDLAIDSFKVSGNAQQRKRQHFLHHGTLLSAFDAANVGRYLHMPTRQPEYRQQRPDTAFLTNLPLTRQEITSRLRREFGADRELEEWPVDAVRQLVASKYGTNEWTRRR